MSASDWDFSHSDHTIDTTVKKYGSSSLKLTDNGCKATYKSITDLYEGQIVSWMVYDHISGSNIPMNKMGFRLDSCNFNSGYALHLVTSDGVTVTAKLITLPSTELASEPNIPMVEGTWYQVRLAWWLSGTDLVIRMQYRSDPLGAWKTLIADYTDSSPVNGTGTKYVGIGCGHNSAQGITWFDNTAIYKEL